MTENRKPAGITVVSVFFILAGIGSISYGIQGYSIYFLYAAIYISSGYGLIKNWSLARTVALVILPIVSILSLGSVAGAILAQNDAGMLAELVELGIDPDSLNTKIAIGSMRLIAAVAAFIYLMRNSVKAHFKQKAEPADGING